MLCAITQMPMDCLGQSYVEFLGSQADLHHPRRSMAPLGQNKPLQCSTGFERVN